MAAMLLHSSLFVLAYAATFYNCTMPPREGECSICKNCVYVTNNFGCKKFGEKRHAATKSVKKCLSKDASCGGEQERCFGALYECEPGYERPDGSSDHAVTCNNGRLDYGPACVKNISCAAEETTTEHLAARPILPEGRQRRMSVSLDGRMPQVRLRFHLLWLLVFGTSRLLTRAAECCHLALHHNVRLGRDVPTRLSQILTIRRLWMTVRVWNALLIATALAWLVSRGAIPRKASAFLPLR